MQILIIAITSIGVIVLAAAICIYSDRIEQRRGLKRLRKRMLLEPDLADQQFAAALSEISLADALRMRKMLADMLGIDPLKIHPDWRFREERDLKNLDLFILHAFAMQYAPDKLRDRRTFQFRIGAVSTVKDLFLEASKLQNGG